MAGFTSQTPPLTLEFIKAKPLNFPEKWTLTEVAEETHRRYLAGHRYESPGVAVTRWAMFKLAKHREFKAEHWKWLAVPDQFGRTDGVSYVMAIIRPAVGDNIAWKKPGPELSAALDEIREAVKIILRGMKANPNIGLSLPEVASLSTELKPVVDATAEMQSTDLASIREEVRLARQEGREPRFGPRPFRGVHQPYLHDFLEALLVKLDGKLGFYAPKLKWDVEEAGEDDDEGDDDLGDDETDAEAEFDPDAAAELARKFGISPTVLGLPRPPLELRPGGDFGAYPNRKDSVERAIIMAFPRALLGDPWLTNDKPADQASSVPMAALIEESCVAWFGKSRSQKDISALIKEERDKLEAAAAEVRAMREQTREIEQKTLAKLKERGGDYNDTLRNFLDLE